MSTAETARRNGWFPRVVAIAGGLIFAAFGIWAMAAPESFFDRVALFPPYNQHFVQDVGAFQIGLGAVLLLAFAAPADALAVGLVGVGIGEGAHTISHVVGHELGGTPSTDIPVFAVLTVLFLAAGAVRWRAMRSS